MVLPLGENHRKQEEITQSLTDITIYEQPSPLRFLSQIPYSATLGQMNDVNKKELIQPETIRDTAPSVNPKPEPGAHALLTRDELAQFQDIAHREYGACLSDSQAYAQATALLSLFETLLKNPLAFGNKNAMITGA